MKACRLHVGALGVWILPIVELFHDLIAPFLSDPGDLLIPLQKAGQDQAAIHAHGDADDIRREYEILLGELAQYNPELLDKRRLLAVTKCDMLDDALMGEMQAHLPEGIPSIFISSVSGYNIPQLKDLLWQTLHE